MLVTLKEILTLAEEKSIAIGSFNTPNLECLRAVIDAAEALNMPVIIAHAQVHEPIGPLSVAGPIMVAAAKEAKVPICVHLDHGEDLDYLKQALEMGFTSVMYDGSLLSYEENVANTLKTVEVAKAFGASVEAEIGVMGSKESADNMSLAPEHFYTDPQLAKRFVEDTGIDALACSFGTVHGLYKAKPKLDFQRIEDIRRLTGVPIVMHGGSGCSEEDYRKAIGKGVRKINYYTYMSREGMKAVKAMLDAQDVTYFHDLAMAAQKAMQQDVTAAMKVFAGM